MGDSLLTPCRLHACVHHGTRNGCQVPNTAIVARILRADPPDWPFPTARAPLPGCSAQKAVVLVVTGGSFSQLPHICRYVEEFDKRNCKMCAISCDDVDSHLTHYQV